MPAIGFEVNEALCEDKIVTMAKRENSLSGQFLIAMPSLGDSVFEQAVVYICEHNAEGTLGVVVNRALDTSLGELLQQVDLPAANDHIAETPVHMGGPVKPEHCLILHSPVGDWTSTLVVGKELGLTGSPDLLEAIAGGAGPARFLVCLGYAGWGAGQLESELADNAWLTGPADRTIMFDIPMSRRWQAAAGVLGIDMRLMSNQVGHG